MDYFSKRFSLRYVYLPILLFTGTTKLISAATQVPALALSDPLFGISTAVLLIGIGVLELGVVGCLCLPVPHVWKHGMVFWLAFQFLLYRLVKASLGVAAPCPCLGNIADWLGLSLRQADLLLKNTAILLLLTSGLCLWATIFRNRQTALTISD